MTESGQVTKAEFAETGLKLDREHDDEKPFSIEHQIALIVNNIKIYLSFLIEESVSSSLIEEIKNKLINQLQFINSDELHILEVENFVDTYPELKGKLEIEGYKGFDNLNSFAEVINSLVVMRQDTEDQETYNKTELIINGFLKQMEIILKEDNFTINRLQQYEVYSNNIDKSCDSNDKQIEEERPTHFFPKQKISFDIDLAPEVFQWVQPPLHKTYVSEVTKAYHEIVPFKIKHITPGNPTDGPKISIQNYFKEDIDPEKAVIHYCQPNTKKLFTYRIEECCKLLTISKQYLFERDLPIQWTFSSFVRTLITPEGRIFSINSKTNSKKIDSAMYEILEEKVSNKGRRPDPKRNSAFIYTNNSLYVIGGNNDNEPCSQKNYRYSLKEKKWSQIADSNIALRKPTVCAYKDRYIIKLGGLNQFNYISKNIQLYDTKTNRWSIVRAAPRNIMEEVQILQDSLATQISEDQIYIFSGKNSNNFQSDSGFILQLNEIIQRQKGPAKVTGEFWNVSLGKRSLYSFFGLFSQSNVITHYNCLYALRVECSKQLPF